MGFKINLEEREREGVGLINLRQDRENSGYSLHAVTKLKFIKVLCICCPAKQTLSV